MANFVPAFDLLIGNEGGYVDNPSDPGGATRYGVTQRVARAHGYTGDMRDLPLEVAREIAKRMYWDPLRCDQYAQQVAFDLFDANYNGGHVVLWMQQAAKVKADGIIGPQTIQAVSECNPDAFRRRFAAARLNYFSSLSTWSTFGRGWARRVASNLLKE